MSTPINTSAIGKRKSGENLPECILCTKTCTQKDNIDNILDSTWTNIKNKARLWKDLDRFGDAYDRIKDIEEYKILYIHSTCRVQLSSSDKLAKAKKRKEKLEAAEKILSENVEEDLSNNSFHANVDEFQPISKRPRRLITGDIHNKDLCIWCMKGKDDRHLDRGKSKFYLISTYSAWYTFKRHVIYLEDNVMRERITKLIDSTHDPFAVEIRYHESCWKQYANKKPTVNIHAANVELKEAQNLFFSHVQDVIFHEHEIRTVQGLLADYKIIVGNYGYPVDSTKSSYIKEILTREFGDRIGFQDRLQVNRSEFVFDTTAGGSYVEAAMTSYGISDEQLLKNVACRLKESVNKTQKENQNGQALKWPCQVKDLEESENIPESILTLLTWLKNPSTSKTERTPVTNSLSSLLMKFITGKRTTFSVNISVTIYGLTKNKEVVDLLHRNGIGISYADVLMLLDYWSLNDLKLSPFCPVEIADKIPAIVVVDNDDFKVDSLTGKSTHAHRTNVMYVQPESIEKKVIESQMLSTDKKSISGELKSISSSMEAVLPYNTVNSSEPPIRLKDLNDKPNSKPQRHRTFVHTLIRSREDGTRPNPPDQTVPMFNGFQSSISLPQEKSKAYYHMTYPVPPSKAVCYDVMSKLVKAMNEKGIPFSFVVGDFPTFLYFLKLKSENTIEFKNVYPHLGPFHMHKSYLSAINKRFDGSGLSDIIVAANAIVSGSVDQALRGEHYKRALRAHFLLREALSMLIIQETDFYLSEEEKEMIRILQQEIAEDNFSNGKETYEKLIYMMKEKIELSYTEIRGSNSDMAEFWLSYCEMLDILMMNVYALHSCHWEEYLSSMYLMIPALIIYDNDKYGKILPDHWAMLSTLPEEEKKFMSTHFAQSMTGNPYSSQPLDLWIECTMNKGSKMKSGWLSILANSKQLLTNTRSPNNINRVRRALHLQSKKRITYRKHKDCSPSRLQADEQVVQDIIDCLNEFGTNPFYLSSPILRTLESGIEVTKDVLLDFKTALQDGQVNLDTLLSERVYSKTKSLFSHMARKRRKNFAKQLLEGNSKDEKSKNLQLREMESTALSAIIDMVSNNGIRLEDLLNFRVTQECLPIFNVNGTYRKVQKSKLLQCFTLDDVSWPNDYIALIDMGMIFRKAVPKGDDRLKLDGSPYLWGDYAKNCADMVIDRHYFAKILICVNDPYSHLMSIKEEERESRRKSIGQIPNVFMKADDVFPNSKMLQTILCGNGNKTRIQSLVRSEFEKRINDIDIVWSVGSICDDLRTGMPIQDYQCHQAEADTILFKIYSAIRENKDMSPVVIDSEDTDTYVQSSFVANASNGNLYIRRKASHVSCHDFCSEDVSKVIIPFHAITGCDSNSGFFGHGKKKVFNKLVNNEEARDLLRHCGDELPISRETLDDLKLYVIKYIYSDFKSSSMAESRSFKWRGQKIKSLSRLPPDDDSLELHCMRANYLSYIQKYFKLTSHPSPIGNGWHFVDGKCKAHRYRVTEMTRDGFDNLSSASGTNVDSDCDAGHKSETDDDSDLSDYD